MLFDDTEVEAKTPWVQNYAPWYVAEGYDAIDVIAAFDLPFSQACAIKYLLRGGRKPGETRLKALQKAKLCIEKQIERELVFAEETKQPAEPASGDSVVWTPPQQYEVKDGWVLPLIGPRG